MRSLHHTFRGQSRRRLLVGDVHGCYDELIELMHNVSFDASHDQVVCVGDMFRKGPKSLEVMAWARANNVLAVRGNHEERLLKQRRKWTKGTYEADGNPDAALMETLTDADFEWLAGLPYSIDFPLDQLLVVHAGLVDGKSLEAHTPFELTEMRAVVHGEAHKLCADVAHQWARQYSGRMAGLGHRHIVFGHDAARGLQLEQFATGLDTGAVYGKHLTCLVVDNDGKRHIATVRSARQYCENAEAKHEK